MSSLSDDMETGDILPIYYDPFPMDTMQKRIKDLEAALSMSIGWIEEAAKDLKTKCKIKNAGSLILSRLNEVLNNGR